MNKSALAGLLLALCLPLFGFTVANADREAILALADQHPALSSDDLKKINAREIVYHNNTFSLPGAMAIAYADVPPEKVFAVITTYPKYLEFMPDILTLEVKESDESASRVYAEYKSQWPFDKVILDSLNVKNADDPQHLKMAWKALHTNFKAAQGAWMITPYEHGSLVFYQLGFDVNWVPRPVAQASGRKRVEHIIKAVIARANAQ